MVLLLSRQEDGSTREVAEWLYSLGKDFIRINADDKKNRFLKCDVSTGGFCIMINNEAHTFNTTNIKSVWNRRSGFSKEALIHQKKGLEAIFHDPGSFAKDHIEEETTVLFEFLNYILEANTAIKKIGNAFYNPVNKLIVLRKAENAGLTVPASYIVTSKSDLISLMKKERRLITKALGNGVYRFTDEYGYYSYTERVTTEWAGNLPDTFFPSLVQKETEKEYELRIFYLEGEFYSMAIFSGEFETTVTDNRKSAETRYALRSVPYLLPGAIQKQLCALMEALRLNTGSIDMVVTPQNQFYFLEVNPVGQFGTVSHPCNYYLEKKIAQAL